MSHEDDRIDFLSRSSDDTMRLHIKNILDSYSHYWDILAELAQNAIDALIERAEIDSEFSPKVQIKINCATRSINIRDNGIGVKREWLGLGDADDHPTILTPNTTFKGRSRRKLIGSKGVGLTFAVFSSNKVTVMTRRPTEDGETVGVSCLNAYNWLYDADVARPALLPQSGDLSSDGWSTEIDLQNIAASATEDETKQDLFDLSQERLIYLLRSRTALGWTHRLFSELRLNDGQQFSEEIHPEVTFQFTDKDGKQSATKKLSAIYQTPAEVFQQHLGREAISSVKFLERVAAKDRSVPGKLVEFKEVLVSRSGRRIAAYALAVPGTHVWSEMVKKSGLQWAEEGPDQADIRPGIWLATRGMPCGVQIATPPGLPGWSDSVFILLEDPYMKFDLGRKGPAGRAPSMYQSVAKELFNKMRKLRVFEHLKDRPDRAWSKGGKMSQMADLMAGLVELPKSAVESCGFVYSPNSQEATVAGMFFHLVGKGVLKGYRFLRSSYGDQYDALIRFTLSKEEIEGASGVAYHADDIENGVFSENVIAEFKYRAESIIHDVKKNRKRFEDFKILVCWSIDVDFFKRNDIKVFPLEKDRRLYWGCQYQLDFHSLLGRDDARLVLCLSELLDVDATTYE